jgi:hypothetical protein
MCIDKLKIEKLNFPFFSFVDNHKIFLFTYNHNISLICLEEIMSLQVPFPGKLLFMEITLLYFLTKFSRELSFFTLFPCKWQKINRKTKFLNRVTMEIFWLVRWLNPQPSEHMSTALSIELWSLNENHKFFVNHY